jgi:hypothetical protein
MGADEVTMADFCSVLPRDESLEPPLVLIEISIVAGAACTADRRPAQTATLSGWRENIVNLTGCL